MMSAGLRAPNGRVQASAPTATGHLSRKTAKPTAHDSDRLLSAREELLGLEQEIRYKDSTIACSKKLLKQKESLVRQLQHDLVKAESERNMQTEALKETEAKNAKLKQQILDTHETFARLQERLHMQCNMKSEAGKLNKLAWDNIELYSSNMAAHARTVEKVFQALSSQKEALKDKNRLLAAELRSCKKELDEKSQQYETAVSQRQTWESRHQKLEESMEQLNAEIERYRNKNDSLVKSNTEVLARLDSRSRELKKEEEKYAKLMSKVRGLHGTVRNPDDFKDPSEAVEVVEAAFNQLSIDCNTLREKEAETAKRVEELEADKSLLVTGNLELSEKLKSREADYIQLQEAKQKLEAKVECERKKARNKMSTICKEINKFRDNYKKILRDRRRFGDVLSDMQALEQNVVRQKEQFGGILKRLQKVDSWMRRQQACHEAERLRLSAECTDKQTTIACLEHEIKQLYEGIANFELLAEAKAEDLVRAEEKIQSLEDDLATTRKEIMPVEEREKAALLLLEKDSLIAQLETKLKDTEEWAVKLEGEHSAASDAAKSLREVNEDLKSALASLAAELKVERERQENKVDSDSQTEQALKDDCDTQTEAATTVDCTTITEETGDISSKLASAQLQLERLSITIQQHNSKTEALRSNLTESDRYLAEARNTCSTLKEQVTELKKQLEDSNKENKEMKEEIHSLESRLASQEKKAQEANSQQLQADGQASAALTAENKKLAAEVEALRANVKASNQRLWHAIESYEMKYGIIERLLSEKQEEVDFLKNEVARLTRNAGGGPLPLHKVFASAAPRKPAQVVAQKPTVVVLTPKTKAGQPAAQGEVSASAQTKPAQVVAGKAAVVASTPVTEPGELASKGPSTPGVSPILLQLLTSEQDPASTASAAHTPKGSSSTNKSGQAVGLPQSGKSKLSLSSRGTDKAGHEGPTDEATTGALKRSFAEREKTGQPTSTKPSQPVAPQPVSKKQKFFKSDSGRN
ncbi:uncharacterized protein LOC144142980 [Haemaphysalis longicornis]